jgi:hypothetical protein
MSDDQKDRFGDKLRDAEKAKEDQFFAERERRLLEKLKARPEEPTGAPAHPPTPPGDARAHEPTTGQAPSGWLARLFGRSR